MSDTKIKLAFGLNEAIPDDAKVAWGARLIITQDGDVDFLWDRQGCDGNDEALGNELLNTLNAVLPLEDLKGRIRGMLTTGIIDTRVAGRVLIYTDEHIKVVGDTKASAGYFYVAAFRPDAEMAGQSKEARRAYAEVVADTGDRQLAADAADLMDEAWAEIEDL